MTVEEEATLDYCIISKGTYPAKIVDLQEARELRSGRGYYIPFVIKIEGYRNSIAFVSGYLPAMEAIKAAKPFYVGKIVDVMVGITELEDRKWNSFAILWNTLRSLEP